jgi:ribosomal protein S18 acetylase RimI-like enzyme
LTCSGTARIDVEIVVTRITDLPFGDLVPLLDESEQEGWKLVRRLRDDWAAGTNRFDRAGEALFEARLGESLVGVCGLNVDPHAFDPAAGRLRRVYVLAAFRRRGIGEALVRTAIAAACGRFRVLRLRTGNENAARLYERLGFVATTGEPDCTHRLSLE